MEKKRKSSFEAFEKYPAGKPIQNLLPTILREIHGKRSENIKKIEQYWIQVVGKTYGDLTKVEKFQNGILYVKVFSASLYSVLMVQEKKKVLDAMQKEMTSLGLKNIVFRR